MQYRREEEVDLAWDGTCKTNSPTLYNSSTTENIRLLLDYWLTNTFANFFVLLVKFRYRVTRQLQVDYLLWLTSKQKFRAVYTVLIGYYDYLGTWPKNSHRPIIVTGR